MDEISSRTINPSLAILAHGTNEEVLEMLEHLRKEAEAAVRYYNNVNMMCRRLRKNSPHPIEQPALVTYSR